MRRLVSGARLVLRTPPDLLDPLLFELAARHEYKRLVWRNEYLQRVMSVIRQSEHPKVGNR